MNWKLPGSTLTVLIRDDSPMIHCGDCPSFRSVRITLTREQLEGLRLRFIGRSGEVDMYEAISHSFIEPELAREGSEG